MSMKNTFQGIIRLLLTYGPESGQWTVIYLIISYYIPDFRDFFNWTWTYRRDSDIIDSYGPFIAKLAEPPPVSSFSERKHPKGRLKST